MLAEDETRLGPRREVVRGSDGARGAVLLTDGPELLESRGALDGRLVHTGGGEEVVGSAVRVDSADLGGAGGRVVGTEGLDDVVLDQRVLGPAVDGQVAVAVGPIIGGVRDGAGKKNEIS